MTTHPNLTVLARYAEGTPELDDATVWSVEVHLETCADCRARLAGSASVDSRAVLDRVAAALDDALGSEPAPARVPRRWSPVRVRWFAGMVVPWLLTTAAALFCAVMLDSLRPEAPSLVLLLAPLAPLPAIAAVWSRRSDPAWELIAGTPGAGLAMMLRRTAAVLAVIVPTLVVAGITSGIVLGDPGPANGLALALLPCLACSAAVLAAGGLIGVPRAAVAVSAGWAAAVIAPSLMTENLSVVLRPGSVPAWVAATAALVAVVLLRARRRLT